MINFIDFEQRLTAKEHFYLFTFHQVLERRIINYSDFHITEDLVVKYNESSLELKQDIMNRVNHNPEYNAFITNFTEQPWMFEKPVLWNDRSHTDYFILQLEKSHAFEVFIDTEFKKRGIDIGLYYGRNAQYSGESAVGIEIKFDERSKETNNFYIEYQERMQFYGQWVNSGILKKDNTRFYLYGTMDKYILFTRDDLLKYYNLLQQGQPISGAKLVREVKHGTSQGFILMPTIWKKIGLTIDQVSEML